MKLDSLWGRRTRGVLVHVGVLLGLLLGHWRCSSYRLPPLSPGVSALPGRLSETGLYADGALREPAADLMAYAPAYELWSDGAQKRRWIRLPPGTRIDTSDMDAWQFPVGTQLWKEFSRQGRRVETRLLTRLDAGPDGWAAVAYLWNADGTEAAAAPEGAQDVLETPHDVPTARACMTCHGGREQRVLGFSALQLSHAPASDRDWTLERLARAGLITAAPAAPLRVPGTPVEAAALGYLHANCGSCHNGARPESASYYRPPGALDLWLSAGALSSPAQTPTYQTALGEYVVPGAPEESKLLRRFTRRSWFRRRMPPLATEELDSAGLLTLTRWIESLSAQPFEREAE